MNECGGQYFASLKRIKLLRSNAKRMYLSAAAEFWHDKVAVLQECYNGVGPACWSSHFRTFVTTVLCQIEESALIHDYGFTHLPKTYPMFTVLNVQFAINVCKEAYHYKRWKLIWLGLALAVLCQLFGWRGFKKC